MRTALFAAPFAAATCAALFAFAVAACSSPSDSGELELFVEAGSLDGPAVTTDAAGEAAARPDATPDAGSDVVAVDAADDADGGIVQVDAGDGGCFLPTGVFGECITTSSCAAKTGYSSTPGYCPGPDDIECCSVTPNTADNPPVPAGWELMMQADVTPAMTTWAVDILNDPTMYPMFSTTIQTFGTLMVLARVEWHPPDFQNGVIHRGVTLYQPT